MPVQIMFEDFNYVFEKIGFDYSLLTSSEPWLSLFSSSEAWLLTAYALLIVSGIYWLKKQQLKFLERRIFRKRQKVGITTEDAEDNPTQLKFDL